MAQLIRRTALLAFALAGLLAVTAWSAARDPFLVPVSAKATGFGPFREGGTQSSAAALRTAFGRPTTTVKNNADLCTMRWKAVGVVAHLTTYGQRIEPCTKGYFVNARLSDKRWHTSAGIRPGSTERAARRASKRSCGDACEFPGYVLGLHPNDCAAAQTPSVIAEVHDGEVVALRVLTHGCE
jgi:hypothetical protein